ncbi:MAG: 5-formyltetrahydrofolate cyclo-ligase [Thermotaleaceae bacterium]
MKKEMRRQVLELRGTLSPEELEKKSMAIFSHLTNSSLYQNANAVMAYIDFRNEVKTDRIIDDLITSNKKAIVPICIPKTREMLLSQLLNPHEELAPAHFGVLEPKAEYIRPVNASNIDLVLVPGVAFDRKGYRIGYGGGYYDRFFEKLPKKIPSLALAFDLQLIDSVPTDAFDQAVDYIVTESGIIQCK